MTVHVICRFECKARSTVNFWVRFVALVALLAGALSVPFVALVALLAPPAHQRCRMASSTYVLGYRRVLQPFSLEPGVGLLAKRPASLGAAVRIGLSAERGPGAALCLEGE